MFRLWGKMMKENRMLRDIVISNGDYTMSRTAMVFDAIDQICYAFDLGHPVWLDKTIEEFKRHDNCLLYTSYNPDMYKGLMQNLQAEAATGNTPALVQIGWAFLDYFSNNFDYVAPQDAIDKFDSEDANFLTANFLPNVLDMAVNSNGEQVGIPYSLSSPVLYIKLYIRDRD